MLCMQKTFVTATHFLLFTEEETDSYIRNVTNSFFVQAVIYVSEIG